MRNTNRSDELSSGSKFFLSPTSHRGGLLKVRSFIPAATDEAQRSLNAAGHKPSQSRAERTSALSGACHM